MKSQLGAHNEIAVVLLMTALTSAATHRMPHVTGPPCEVIYTSACVLHEAVHHRSVDSTSRRGGTAFRSSPAARGCTDLSAYLTITDTGSLLVSSDVAPLSRLAATRRTNDRLHG